MSLLMAQAAQQMDEPGSFAFPGLGMASGIVTAFYASIEPTSVASWFQMLVGLAVLAYSTYLVMLQRRAATLRAIRVEDEAARKDSLLAKIDEATEEQRRLASEAAVAVKARDDLMRKLDDLAARVERLACPHAAGGQARCQTEEAAGDVQ